MDYNKIERIVTKKLNRMFLPDNQAYVNDMKRYIKEAIVEAIKEYDKQKNDEN